MSIFKNANLYGELVDIEVENGKIEYIGKSDKDGIDLGGNDVFAGLVDIHSHGCVGYDTMDGKYLNEMSVYEARSGITSWYPTTVTMDEQTIKRAVNVVIGKTDGANILGFHLEGPYVSKKYKGAQNEDFIRKPDIEEFKRFENIKVVTIAPEMPGAMEFIKKCGARVSIGHTEADYDTAIKAIEAGATCLTHTFNAMPPLHHREPGVIGAAVEKNIYVEVISDGLHLHPSVVKMLYKIFGKDRMILISDSMRGTGMPDGEYDLGGQMMSVKSGVARTPDGSIAGSTTNLFGCVKRAIEFGIPRADAYYMASATPSEYMGVDKGIIETGRDADFIVVDKDDNLIMTVVGGNVIG